MMNGRVLEDREVGQKWTVGNVDLGCYDTYQCLQFRVRITYFYHLNLMHTLEIFDHFGTLCCCIEGSK